MTELMDKQNSELIAKLQKELAQKDEKLQNIKNKINQLKTRTLYNVKIDHNILSDDEDDLLTGYDLSDLVDRVRCSTYSSEETIPHTMLTKLKNNSCCCCDFCTNSDFNDCMCSNHYAVKCITGPIGSILDTDTLEQRNKKMEDAFSEKWPEKFDFINDNLSDIGKLSGEFVRDFIEDLEKEF